MSGLGRSTAPEVARVFRLERLEHGVIRTAAPMLDGVCGRLERSLERVSRTPPHEMGPRPRRRRASIRPDGLDRPGPSPTRALGGTA